MACEQTCQVCNSTGSGEVTITSYSTGGTTSYLGSDYITISGVIKSNNYVLPVDACVCLFSDGAVLETLYFDNISALNPSRNFAFTSFVMGSVNRRMHISVISGTGLPIVGGYVCTAYRNFELTVKVPPGEGYRCNQTTKLCEPDTSSTVPKQTCEDACSGTSGGGGCIPACSKDSMCLFGMCVKKNDLLIGGVAILAFMYVSKQR